MPSFQLAITLCLTVRTMGAVRLVAAVALLLAAVGATPCEVTLNLPDETPANRLLYRLGGLVAARFDLADGVPRFELEASAVVAQLFTVNAAGELSARVAIDRDSLCDTSIALRVSAGDRLCCDGDVLCSFSFNVIVQSNKKTNMFCVGVNVTDANDNRPTFPESYIRVHVEEGKTFTRFQSLRLPLARDPDSVRNGVVNYTLDRHDTGSRFGLFIVPERPPFTELGLEVREPLDREARASYSITLVAIDGGTGEQFKVPLIVTVLDVNDSPPRFERPVYTVSASERRATVGTEIVRVLATDPDERGELSYRLAPGGGGASDAESAFAVDERTGAITVRSALDYETLQQYRFRVQVSDGVHSDVAEVVVNVNDENDSPPRITFIALRAAIPENQKHLDLSLVSVEDPDSGLNSDFLCSVNEPQHFLLNQTSCERDALKGRECKYKLQMTRDTAFDREERSELAVNVSCTDHGVPPLTASQRILIAVLDENDNYPHVRDEASLTAAVDENASPVPTFLTRLNFADEDEGRNAQLRFELLDEELARRFTVDSNGQLFASVALDREERAAYAIPIRVADEGTPSLSVTVTARVTVRDRNDEAPLFAPALPHTFHVPENAPAGTLVAQLEATDRDEGDNGRVVYSLEPHTPPALVLAAPGGAPLSQSQPQQLQQPHAPTPAPSLELPFRIDENGTLYTTRALDREALANGEFMLTVRAADRARPPRSSTFLVQILVDDENDNPPHIGNASVNVSAAESVDSVFLELRAEDPDVPAPDSAAAVGTGTGVGGPFTYAIDAGNERALFKVAATTGQLALARRAEPSDYGYHTLAMHVSDGRHSTPFIVLVNVDPRLAPSLNIQRLGVAGGAGGEGAAGSSMAGSSQAPTLLELILLIAALVSLMVILVLIIICVALLLMRRRGGCCGRRVKQKLRGVGVRRSASTNDSPATSPDEEAMQQIVLMNRQGLLYAPLPPSDAEAALHSTTNSSNVTGAAPGAAMLQVASPTNSNMSRLAPSSNGRLASLTKLQMPASGARSFNLVVDEGIHTPGSISGGSSVSSHRNDLNLSTLQRAQLAARMLLRPAGGSYSSNSSQPQATSAQAGGWGAGPYANALSPASGSALLQPQIKTSRAEGEWPSPDNSDLVLMNRAEGLGVSPRGSLAPNNNNTSNSNDCHSGSLAPDPVSERGPTSASASAPGPGAGVRLEEARSFTVANPNARLGVPPARGGEREGGVREEDEEGEGDEGDNGGLQFANCNFTYCSGGAAAAIDRQAPDCVTGPPGSWQRSPYRLFANGSQATRLDLITERSENSTTYQESPAGPCTEAEAGPGGPAAHYSPSLQQSHQFPGTQMHEFQGRPGGSGSNNGTSCSTPSSPYYCVPNVGFRTAPTPMAHSLPPQSTSRRAFTTGASARLQPPPMNPNSVADGAYDGGRPRSPASISEVLEKHAVRSPAGPLSPDGAAAQGSADRERERGGSARGSGAASGKSGTRGKWKGPKRKDAKSPKPAKQKRAHSTERSGSRNRTDRGAALTPIPRPAGAAVISAPFPFPLYQLHSPSHDPMSLSYVNCGCAECHVLQEQLLRTGAGVLQPPLGSPTFQPVVGLGALGAPPDEMGAQDASPELGGPEELELCSLTQRTAAGDGGGGVTSVRATGGSALGSGARPPSRNGNYGPLPVAVPVPPQSQYDSQPRAPRDYAQTQQQHLQRQQQNQNASDYNRDRGWESASAERALTTFSPMSAPGRAPHPSSQAALVETSFI